MKIEDIENREQLFTALLEDAVKKGDVYILMPLDAMGQEAAIALAKRLDISVMIQGDEYAFTTTQEATQALLSTNETKH